MKFRSILQQWRAAIAGGLMLVCLMTACHTPEPPLTTADVAVIVLGGNAVGSTLIIDNRLSFQITADNKQMHFKVRPGDHHVRVERAGAVVLDRSVSLAKDDTIEINVP